MIALRRISRCLAAWEAWRLRSKVERQSPELAELRKREAEARRRHRPTRHFQQAKQAVVNARLAREMGVTLPVTLPEGLTS